jgi:WD40 repeat protein
MKKNTPIIYCINMINSSRLLLGTSNGIYLIESNTLEILSFYFSEDVKSLSSIIIIDREIALVGTWDDNIKYLKISHNDIIFLRDGDIKRVSKLDVQGSKILAVNNSNFVTILDEEEKYTIELEEGSHPSTACFIDNDRLATSSEGELCFIEKSGVVSHKFILYVDSVLAFIYEKQHKNLLILGQAALALHDMNRNMTIVIDAGTTFLGAAFFDDGKSVVYVKGDELFLYNIQNEMTKIIANVGYVFVFALFVHPETHHIYLGGADGRIQVWDIERGEKIMETLLPDLS